MKTSLTHILLLVLLAFLATGTAASADSIDRAAAVTELSEAASEFCGTSDGPQIRCPKTQASKCACSLSGKKVQGEQTLKPVSQAVKTIKLPRPARRFRQLPEPLWSLTCKTFQTSVPTPPPRS